MESEFHLGEYIAILKRRYIYLVLPFLLVLGGSAVVAVLMPPVYQSSGTILIESAQIPDELIQSTVTSLATERIEIIKQRVMTRANLYRISEKFNIFRDDKDVDSTTKVVAKMRELAAVQFISSDGGKRRSGTVAIAFKVSFEHRRPEIATRVANELVTLFLDENVKSRTARASETNQFLTQEAEKLEKNLQDIEDKIAAYKQENATALPEHLDLRLQMRDRSEAEFKELDREIKALLEEQRFLEIEMAGLKAGYRTRQTMFEIPQKNLASPAAANLDRELSEVEILTLRLNDLEARLSEAKTRYSESHPDVKRLTSEIETTREQLASVPPVVNEVVPLTEPVKQVNTEASDPIMATVQAKIASANSRIRSMHEQKKQLRVQISEIESMIIQTPQVERAIKVLNRDYVNAEKKYNEVKAKQMQAQLSKNLEEDRKAERFVLLEPPVMPEEPIRPNRKKMLALGFALSLAAGGGGIFLVEMIDGSIRGTSNLAAVTKLQPLASIPYIVTTREARKRKRIKVLLVLLLIAAMLGALIAVHVFYMSLDIVFYKILARF